MSTSTADMLDGEKALRHRITVLSRSLREVTAVEHLQKPRYVGYDTVRGADGTIYGRKKAILMSGGCSVPTCTMCPFTNYNNFGLHGANGEGLREQVVTLLRRTDDEPDYNMLALYNDGSFFARREVSADVQLDVARRVAATGVRRLVVESLPQFLTAETLAPFVEALGDVQLEVGIGLQSANRLVRETLVNTRITRGSFEDAVALMRAHNVISKVYLMIKPPFLTDGEAITDVISSTEYVASLGVDGVTLCPTRLAPNTVAWWLYQRGHYRAPNLWTVVDAIRGAHAKAAVRVAHINIRGTDFDSVYPDSCERCANAIVDGLASYSVSGDLTDLPSTCDCRPDTGATDLDHNAILTRTAAILDVCELIA
jgi:radical SAM enzyme (TIGR01210 family)